MEIHQHHDIKYAAVDSGALDHFFPIEYTSEQHNPTKNPIRVGKANKAVMVSLVMDIIHFNKIPLP